MQSLLIHTYRNIYVIINTINIIKYNGPIKRWHFYDATFLVVSTSSLGGRYHCYSHLTDKENWNLWSQVSSLLKVNWSRTQRGWSWGTGASSEDTWQLNPAVRRQSGLVPGTQHVVCIYIYISTGWMNSTFCFDSYCSSKYKGDL